jgi:hypothetical protein
MSPGMGWRAGLDDGLALQSSGPLPINSAMSENTSETLPDRLSTDPKSPFHNAELLERGVGIRFNGVDRNNVEEYCVSEGWVRLAVGKTVDRHGNAMTVKYKGKVEPYLRAPE